MSWVQENKFLTGLLAVTVIGAGFLGYKVVSASGAAADADSRFETKAKEYNRLRGLAPFPKRENLAVYEAQKAEATEVISAFQKDLAKQEFPIEPMAPEQFQDKLKSTVTAMRGKMADAGVKFPDKFYLGFERYETVPPSVEAAPKLGRQLKAIEWALDQFVSSHISELKELKRTDLPEEKGKAPASSSNANSSSGSNNNKPKVDLVSAYPFTLAVAGRQDRVAAGLNLVVSPKAPQFFIPRTVKMKNSADKPPARAQDNQAPPPGVTPPDGGPAPAPTPVRGYIVGNEEVELAVSLEMIDFAESLPAPQKKP